MMAGTITHEWTGTILTITSDSGTSSVDLKGGKGDTGPRGAQGPAGMFIAPLITPVLHAYFDVFSGFIQTTVFVLLTMVFIQNEQVEDEDIGIETKLA